MLRSFFFGRGGGPYQVRDAFGADGALDGRVVGGLTWYAPTWATSSGKALNTPGLGDELMTDADMEANNAAWIDYSTPTSHARSDEQKHGGTYSRKVVADASKGARQNRTGLTAGAWYRLAGYIYPTVGSVTMSSTSGAGPSITTPNEWTAFSIGGKATATTASLLFYANAAGTTFYLDDTSFKRVNDADMFATLPTGFNGSSGLALSVGLNHPFALSGRTYAGLVCNLDSVTNPLNYLLVYRNAVSIYFDKVIAGVATNLVTENVAYVVGTRLGLTRSGNSYRVYNGGVPVGAAQTITDAEIINNTRHGMFSSLDVASLVNFTLTAKPVKTVCIIGDSISNDATAVADWPYHLAAAGNPGIVYLKNHATTGHSILTNMDAQVTAAASDDADNIVILLGVNDTTTTGLEAEYLENLLELKASNPRATIYALGILPTSTQDARRTAYNPLIASAAATAGVTYVNTDGWIVPAEDCSDGLHPNATGAAKVAAQIGALLSL